MSIFGSSHHYGIEKYVDKNISSPTLYTYIQVYLQQYLHCSNFDRMNKIS